MGIKSRNQRGVEVWRRKTKGKIIAGFGGCCNKCGYDLCCEALDLHHIDPSVKEFSISNVWARPKAWEKMVAEIKKCVLLCCRCHREFHSGLWSLNDIEIRFFNLQDCDNKIKNEKTGVCLVCGKDVCWGKKTCSSACAGRLARNVNWPQNDVFMKMFEKNSQQEVACLLGVSRSGLQKHLRRIRAAS